MLCRGWAGEQLWVERPGSPSRVAGPATGQQRSQGVTMDTTVLIWVLGGGHVHFSEEGPACGAAQHHSRGRTEAKGGGVQASSPKW